MITSSSKYGRFHMDKSEYDVLIIDDSKYVIDFMEKFLGYKGYSSKAVNSTLQATEELKVNKPKLIILDINLPDSNGYEFCKMVKSNEKYKDILVYYFSGAPESEVMIKTIETKADGYLKKPFDVTDFDDLLEYLD